jgi:hypothetical protein
MKMVTNKIYRSYRTMGCFYNLLTFYLQKQSCIVKSFSALLQQQFMNYGSLMPKKVKSSCLASWKEAKFNDKIYTLHGTQPSLSIQDFSAD